jgi:hypothetical protein
VSSEYPDALNAVCPYFTMFPLDFPLNVLAKERNKEAWVFDPFCGRGTTNFAARLKGNPSIGIDSSPVATAIAEAKLATTSAQAVDKCATSILRDSPLPTSVPNELFWKWAYNEKTLLQICRLREELLRDCRSSVRKVLRALILGALHGPTRKGLPSYLSNQSPRTFAPKPSYAIKFWNTRRLLPPPVDVLGVIRRRAERFVLPQLPSVTGRILNQDSRNPVTVQPDRLFSWVITSPPYYGMKTYLPDQWLRNWFIGGPSHVDYQTRCTDLQHSTPSYFSTQLGRVWRNAATISAQNARLVCRFGGIHDRKTDCLEIIKSSFKDSGWRLTTIRNAGTALNGRRQAPQFGERQKQHPREEYDVYAKRQD